MLLAARGSQASCTTACLSCPAASKARAELSPGKGTGNGATAPCASNSLGGLQVTSLLKMESHESIPTAPQPGWHMPFCSLLQASLAHPEHTVGTVSSPEWALGTLSQEGLWHSPSSNIKSGTCLPGCLALKSPNPTGLRPGLFTKTGSCLCLFCLDLHVLLCRSPGLGSSVCSQQDCISWRGRQGWESLTGCLH